ncbi:MAG: DinB family protein [Verrucomicrobiota bacterium]
MNQSALTPPVSANLSLLSQCAALLETFSPEIYSAKEPPVFPSSIGAHVRHVLDHYDSLLAGVSAGLIDYHSRERDADTEVHISRALERIRDIRDQMTDAKWSETDLSESLQLRVSAEDPPKTISSTLERELFFSLSHSIHHFALIAMTARRNGSDIPSDFGVAPSTLSYRKTLEEKSNSSS